MSLSFVRSQSQLPSYVDHQCAICLEDVDPRGRTSIGTPNCVICINGHRMHKECYDSWGRGSCPTCRVTQRDGNIKHCYAGAVGYGYAQRYGGRRRNKTHKKRKTHKRKKTRTNRR